jgi:thiol-disulfide isomerase/thioredoxin
MMFGISLRPNKHFKTSWFWSLCVCSLFWGWSNRVQAIEVGDTLSLGKIQSVQGQTFTSDDWAKRNTIVQVWATWCSYCRTQNKHLQQLRQKVPADQLNIVTLSIDRSSGTVKDYLEKNQYTFPVVMMTPELSKAIGKRRGVPEVYVINPQGRVIQKDYGLMVDLDFADLARYAQKSLPSINSR